MNLTLIGLDLVAILLLVFGLYLPRHHRRDLATALIGVNVGVVAVSTILAGVEVGIGVGLGLFGVLSIIRLRSDELRHHEIAYYFAALALGLLGGINIGNPVLSGTLMALVLGSLFIADHPRILPRNRRQMIVLDRAIANENELKAHLASELDAQILEVTVIKLDQVNESTTVDVHFRPNPINREVAADDMITRNINLAGN